MTTVGTITGATTTVGTTEATTGTNAGFSPQHGRPDDGAAAAFVGDLYAKHGRMVLGLCRLLLRDGVEAEDAAQQVFVSAQRAVLSGVVPREPAAWLAAIARNECRARIRARMREPLALYELPADLPDSVTTAIRSADLELLWTALAELPRRQRKAFLLRELGGLSYAELGAALGVSRPAVESLLFRARQQLREALTVAGATVAPVSRFFSDFWSAGAPVKVAAVAVGASVGAAGVVALPHDRAPRTPATQIVQHRSKPRASSVRPSALVETPVVSRPALHDHALSRRMRAARPEHGSEREHATIPEDTGSGDKQSDDGDDTAVPPAQVSEPEQIEAEGGGGQTVTQSTSDDHGDRQTQDDTQVSHEGEDSSGGGSSDGRH